MHVLVLDDDELQLALLREALETDGHTCESFSHPREALERYVKGRFDAVVTDVNMPEIDGIEVLKRIRSSDREARVLIMTAYGDLNVAVDAINNGASGFFAKPIDLKEFVDTLRKIEADLKREQKEEENLDTLREEYDRLKTVFDELKGLLDEKKPADRAGGDSEGGTPA
jgi:DNA-binding NtrC family response regulator